MRVAQNHVRWGSRRFVCWDSVRMLSLDVLRSRPNSVIAVVTHKENFTVYI